MFVHFIGHENPSLDSKHLTKSRNCSSLQHARRNWIAFCASRISLAVAPRYFSAVDEPVARLLRPRIRFDFKLRFSDQYRARKIDYHCIQSQSFISFEQLLCSQRASQHTRTTSDHHAHSIHSLHPRSRLLAGSKRITA